MKHFSTAVLLAAFMFAPAIAQEVPFATPPFVRKPSDSAVGTLANIMENIQLRHIKLWFAGKAKNWDLLGYEAQKLEDDFFVAAGFYQNLPVENLALADQPLKRMMEAAKTKDYPLYARAFDELTAGCNSCHVAGQVGFIQIQTPRSSHFSDQRFER